MLSISFRLKTWFNDRFFALSFSNLFLFGFFWLMVGFSTGISVLICPVRWLTTYARENDWAGSSESLSVRLIILTYVLLTFLYSLWITRITLRTRITHVKVLLPLLWLSLTAGSIFLMLHPKSLNELLGSETRGSSRFTFGPYPEADRLKTLKEQGYSGVISLLHPAVVPFEPKLMAEEKEAAQLAGIELISAPMLPWISQNENSLNIIKSLVKEKKGKFYIHCYLGKDRVRTVLQLIQNLEPEIKFKTRPSYYTIKNISGFERGEIITLADSVYLTPLPTDDEFMSFVLSGNIKQVVNLLDPGDPSESEWMGKEEKVMKDLSMNYLNIPLAMDKYDPEAILAAARKIKTLPKPLVVHDFRNVSPVIKGFINCFEYDKPCLATNLISTRLSGGKVVVGGINFATGPRPTREEFGVYFSPYGIRNFLYAGPAGSQEEIEDSGICKELGLNFRVYDSSVSSMGSASSKIGKEPTSGIQPQMVGFFKGIPEGGPWYVYGPDVPKNIIAGIDCWDDGPIIPLDLTVFLAPFPNERELESSLLNGYVEHIACLADLNDPKDISWTDNFQKAIKGKIPFQIFQVTSKIYDPDQILSAARKIRTLPKPLVILVNHTNSALSQGFTQAYYSDKPPLLQDLFPPTMTNGPAEVVAVNIAMGPRPTEDELRTTLKNAGIREIVYLGNYEQLSAQEDQAVAEKCGLKWRAVITGKYEICSLFKNGGPFYIYGPDSETFKVLLRNYLGPPVLRGPVNATYYNISDSDRASYLFSSGRIRTDFGVMFAQFLKNAFPDLKTLVLLSPVLVFYTMLCAGFAGWCRSHFDLRIPYTRKIFHFLIFTAACLLQVFGGLSMVVLFGIIVTLGVLYSVFRGEFFPFYEAIARETDRPHRSLFVVIPLFTTALGGILSNIFFGPFSSIGYLVGGWGDAVGEPIGSRWGKHQYKVFSLAGVPATRSYEGSIGVCLVGSLAAILALSLSGNSLGTSILVGLACGISGALVESFSNHGLDNLTIQVTASAIACYFLG